MSSLGETEQSVSDDDGMLTATAAHRSRRHGRRALANIAEFFETFFALQRTGAVAVLALPAHRHAEIACCCAHTDAVAWVVADFSADEHRVAPRYVAKDCGVVGRTEQARTVLQAYLRHWARALSVPPGASTMERTKPTAEQIRDDVLELLEAAPDGIGDHDDLTEHVPTPCAS